VTLLTQVFDIKEGFTLLGLSAYSGPCLHVPGTYLLTHTHTHLPARILYHTYVVSHTWFFPGVFKASSFYEMLERLWAAMFDLLLKMSNMFKDRRCVEPSAAGMSRCWRLHVLS